MVGHNLYLTSRNQPTKKVGSFVPMAGEKGWEISRGGASRRFRWCACPTTSLRSSPREKPRECIHLHCWSIPLVEIEGAMTGVAT
jgi:hypothetical protein